MFRSFIVSTMALTWPVPNATLFVTVAVPVVSRLIAVVDVPDDGSARRAVFLNCKNDSMSKYFRASSFNVLSMIAASGIKRVIYVSCNPAALARDAKLLHDAGYRLLAATPVDQFLWSARLESVCVFGR